ncbi:MAG: IclR family transcriptional regulator [Geminicoccaceae bacterium]
MWPLESIAKPLLERVRDATSETVQLAVLDGFRVLYVAKIDGTHMLRLESSVGLRLPPHATGGGKTLLAGLSDSSLTTWLENATLERYTPSTITSRTALLQEIAGVRRAGYAVDREEILIGATCVAVGVRNHPGATVAAMSVAGATVRLRKREQEFALRQLRAAAAELSAALGYSGTPTASQDFGIASIQHPST